MRDERGILFTYLSEMCDYCVHSENFTENELIIDQVHESQEINYLFHESRDYFCSRITGNNFVLSRFTAIRNRHSRHTKNPLSDPLINVFFLVRQPSMQMSSYASFRRLLSFSILPALTQFIIWLCLTRTGNYQIHEFDWLKVAQ